jgi:DNA invertase Pin-like site-specific DNA recombinase
MTESKLQNRPLGYARVSTYGQTLGAQLDQLRKAGCTKIYREKLGGLADVERDLIRTRTAEVRSRAKARGQHMGRPPKLTPQQQKEARRRRAHAPTVPGKRCTCPTLLGSGGV